MKKTFRSALVVLCLLGLFTQGCTISLIKWPTFPTASVPSEAQFADALDWAVSNGLIPAAQKYTDTIDGSYLPK